MPKHPMPSSHLSKQNMKKIHAHHNRKVANHKKNMFNDTGVVLLSEQERSTAIN